jgi:hypothetical protein
LGLDTAYVIKIEAQGTPGCKGRFFEWPTIATIRRFRKAALHAYISTLQHEGKTKDLPKAEGDALALLLDQTTPKTVWTPEIEQAFDNGHTIMEWKALAKLDAEQALEKPSMVVKYGLAA